MKRIKLNNDFGINRKLPENKEAPSDQVITTRAISRAMSLGYKEGLPSDKRRIWSKLEDKMIDAADAGEKFFDINDYEYLLLKGAYDKAIVPTNETKSFTVVEMAVLDADEVKETKSKK